MLRLPSMSVWPSAGLISLCVFLTSAPLSAQKPSASSRSDAAQTVGTTAADAAVSPQEWENRRVLNEHTFIPSSDVPGPFVTSYVRALTGLGIALGLDVPVENLDGDLIGTLEGDLAFLILEFEYQQAVAKWLALRASVAGSARLGTDEVSLLAQGISSVNGFAFGATARILEKEKFLLSAAGDVKRSTLYSISPLEFVRTVRAEGFDPGGDNSLVQSGDNFRGSLGLRLAYSPSQRFGFTALGEAGFGDPFRERDENQGVIRLAGTAGLDLGAGTSVPLGILLAGRFDNFTEQGEDIVDDAWIGVLRVSYTGRADFNIGIESAFARLNLKESDETIDALQYRLSMRYYF